MNRSTRSALSAAGLGLSLAACATTPPAEAPQVEVAPRSALARTQPAPLTLPPTADQPARGAEVELVPGRPGLLSPVADGLAQGGPADVTLDVADAGIADAARLVLGETLGAPFTVDPALTGRVTLRSGGPVTRAQAIAIFEAALRSQGAALIRVGDVYQVVPLDQAQRRTGGLVTAAEPGYGAEAVPLRYVAAPEMQRLVAPLAQEGAILASDPVRNVLTIAGTGAERAALRETIGLFDVDWLAGMSYALIRPSGVSVDDLARELTQIYGDQNQSLVRFVPLPRIGALLAISPRESALRDVASWARRLDSGRAAGGGKRIYYRRLENARAADVAATLTAAFADGAAPVTAPGSAPAVSTAAAEAPTDPAQAAEPAPADEDQAPQPRDVFTTREQLPNGARAVQIVTDEPNNAVVVRASPGDFAAVDAIIRAMDVVPDQVLIEITIAEVSLTDDLRFGVEWFLQNAELAVSFSELPAPAPQFPGFNVTYVTPDTQIVLSALESVTDVNVISTPRLLSLDNETARLQVGDQVPVVTQQAIARSAGDAPIVNSVQLRDTGIVLAVTPRIAASGVVFLDIAQEVSDAVPTQTSGIDSPTIRQRRLESRVAVSDGETVALGGLMRRSETDGRSGIPVLMDLPVIGEIFGTRSRQGGKTELIMFLTPRVVRSPEAARTVTAELRRALAGVRPLLRGTALDAGP